MQELRCMQRFHKEVKHVCLFLGLSFSQHVIVHASFLKIFSLKLGRLTQRKP